MVEIRSQYRFFLPPECFADSTVTFPDETASQLLRVLRLRSGANVIALDGSGRECVLRLEVEGRSVAGHIERVEINQAEPVTLIHLFQAIPKAKKLETVLRQCTEIGVSEFTPMVSECVAKGAETAVRPGRLQDVVREAAEQCGRGRLPVVNEVRPFVVALEQEPGGFFFSNEDERNPSNAVLDVPWAPSGQDGALRVFIGPEGGFSQAERDAARAHGCTMLSMGPRTFRVDTAAVVACSMLLHQYGDV